MENEDIESNVARKVRKFVRNISLPTGVREGTHLSNVLDVIHIKPPVLDTEHLEKMIIEYREKVSQKKKALEQEKKELKELEYKKKHCEIALCPEMADDQAIMEKENELKEWARVGQERACMREEDEMGTAIRDFETVVARRCANHLEETEGFAKREKVLTATVRKFKARRGRLRKAAQELRRALGGGK